MNSNILFTKICTALTLICWIYRHFIMCGILKSPRNASYKNNYHMKPFIIFIIIIKGFIPQFLHLGYLEFKSCNKWVWGRCLSKLREPQASVKVTMTTLWAATTRHRHTESLSGKFSDTYQDPPRGWEGLGAKMVWLKHKQRQRVQNNLTSKGAL